MLSVKLEGIEDAMKELDPRRVSKAARASIDRAAKSGAATATDSVLKRWNVKRSDFKDRLKITPPRIDNLSAIITVSGRGMSLSYFGAKQITGNRVMSRKGKEIVSARLSRNVKAKGPVPIGVMVQVLKGKQTTLLRNSFLQRVKSGHIGVFYRLTKKRHPIMERGVISIGSMVNQPEVMTAVVDKIEEVWSKEFPRQLEYFKGKW